MGNSREEKKQSPSRKVVAIVLIVFFLALFAIYEAGLWLSFLAQLGIIPPPFYERESGSALEPLEPVMWEKPEYIVKVNSTYWEVLEPIDASEALRISYRGWLDFRYVFNMFHGEVWETMGFYSDYIGMGYPRDEACRLAFNYSGGAGGRYDIFNPTEEEIEAFCEFAEFLHSPRKLWVYSVAVAPQLKHFLPEDGIWFIVGIYSRDTGKVHIKLFNILREEDKQAYKEFIRQHSQNRPLVLWRKNDVYDYLDVLEDSGWNYGVLAGPFYRGDKIVNLPEEEKMKIVLSFAKHYILEEKLWKELVIAVGSEIDVWDSYWENDDAGQNYLIIYVKGEPVKHSLHLTVEDVEEVNRAFSSF